MKLPHGQLQPEIRQRLAAIARDPRRVDGWFQARSRATLAWSGLTGGGIVLLLMVTSMFLVDLPLVVWLVLANALGVLIWASASYLLRLRRSSIPPMCWINPLYFIIAELDGVIIRRLWHELASIDIVHRHVNGIYCYTLFHFAFRDGSDQPVRVWGKKPAERLAQRLERYRLAVSDAIDRRAVAQLARHDPLIELRLRSWKALPGSQTAPSTSDPRSTWRLAVFVYGSGIGTLIALAASLASRLLGQR